MDLIRTRIALSLRKVLVRVAGGLAVALVLIATNAGAVFTVANVGGSSDNVQLRVGSANATVNTVTFNVINANVSPTPTAVTGTPGNGTPATVPANGTEIRITARMPNNRTRTIRLNADSSAGLQCVVGSGCGTTVIPFSTISWTSYNKQVGGAFGGSDIQDGQFTGAGTQFLVNASVTDPPGGGGSQVVVANVLIFRYDNATLYPSGQYTGRVVFTAVKL